MKKLFWSFSLFVFLFIPTSAWAVCPVCTVAVGAGLSFTRYLGIDDSITGLWIGGFILSSGLWLADWLIKKGKKIPYVKITATAVIFFLTIPPLALTNFLNQKIIIGTIGGALLFACGVNLDQKLRQINNNKVFIYYQKVIAPVLLLTLGSFAFFLITR